MSIADDWAQLATTSSVILRHAELGARVVWCDTHAPVVLIAVRCATMESQATLKRRIEKLADAEKVPQPQPISG